MKFLNKKMNSSILLATLSGVMMGTSFIPFYPWAIFFCFAPLWIAFSKAKTARNVFFLGWITQFFLGLIGFYWICIVTVEFGHMPWTVGIIATLAYAMFSHLYFPIAGVIWYYFFKTKNANSFQDFLAIAILTALGEAHFPKIFIWFIGNTWYWADWPGFQTADVFGFWGLSLFTFIANASIAFFFTNKSSKFRWGVPSIVFSFFILINIWGHFKGIHQSEKLDKSQKSVKIGIIQGNIGNFEKFYAEHKARFREPIISKYFSLTEELVRDHPDIDLIVWPETAYPGNLNRLYKNLPYASRLREFIKKNQISLLTGGYSEKNFGETVYNSVFLFDSSAELKGTYQKTILLAFGEYLPGASWFPFLKNLIPAVSHFSRGPGPMTLKSEDILIGPQICYEGLFPWFTKELSKLNTDLIVNVTNDSWFGQKTEPFQHLYLTLSRAIEFRKPLVRSTNTGISTVVLSNGKILQKSPQNETWTGIFEIPLLSKGEPTFFQHLGYLLFPSIAVLTLLVLGWRKRKE